MKFVIALLIGAASAAAPAACDKDGKCPADHCCANLTGGDPTKGKDFATAQAEIEKGFDELVAGNSGGKGGVCFNNKAAAKGTYVYDEAPATADDGKVDPDMRGAEIEWACRVAAPPKKDEKAPAKDAAKDGAKDGAKDEKKDEKKDGEAAKEGERGTIKEGDKCNHKEKGKGCVEKMCCGKVSGVDLSGLPKEMEAGKEAMKKAMDEALEKAKESGDGVCAAEDKTEYEDPKSKAKMTYECSAVALATTAAVALSAMVNL